MTKEQQNTNIEGFTKDDKDKIRYSLIEPIILKAHAEVLTYGANKYEVGNWKKVDNISRYMDAAYRHIEAYRQGQNKDEESGLSHLAHAITNLGFILYLQENKIPKGDIS